MFSPGNLCDLCKENIIRLELHVYRIRLRSLASGEIS